ncbi:MAG: 4Fe-4S binding protein [Chromatiaceae bacterium]
MPQRLLKPLRIIVAVVFLAGTAWLFLDLEGHLPAPAFDAVLYLQLGPSLVRFSEAAGWAAAGFAFVLGLTFLFGRVFCSTVCPLGTLQDLVTRAANRLPRRARRAPFRYRHPHSLLRYGLLVAVAATAFGGSGFLLAQLDPFSHFGRIMALLARPVAVSANNLAARVLEWLGTYVVAPLDFTLAHWPTVLGPLSVLAILMWMAARHGRLFCNSLCPIGALLGIVSRVALFRIGIDAERCSLCAKCSIQCKAECIHLKDKRVDFDRCVACFNCIPACPESGIGYRLAWTGSNGHGDLGRRELFQSHSAFSLLDQRERGAPAGGVGSREAAVKPPWTYSRRPRAAATRPKKAKNPNPYGIAIGEGEAADDRTWDGNNSRRRFLRVAAWTAALTGTAALCRAKDWPRNQSPTLLPVVKQHPVAPPGAGTTERFTGACTACQLCVSACPTQVLQPSLLAYGLSGLLKPRMAYEVAYCTYECTRCGEVCPTDAIRHLTPAAKKLAKVGDVHFIQDNCIVVTEKTACGACAEHCPTQAVHMIPYEGDLTVPDLETAVCIGCGACEHACPVRPYRAIYVEGEPVQKVAEAPRSEVLKVEVPDEFPF